MILLDANVLIYAYDPDDSKHRSTRAFIESSFADEFAIGIPWVSILAFIRIGTNKRVYVRPRTMQESCDLVSSWLSRANVAAVSPGPNHWSIYQRMLVEGQAYSNHTTDAHLAALAVENGAILVTADRDFARFPGLKTRFLT